MSTAPRLMYDSTTATDIPQGSRLVMGYVDGSSKWSDEDWLRFSGRIVVRICVFNNRFDAQVIDVEPGNCDALSCVSWVRGKWERGETPTVYCFSQAGPIGYRYTDVRQACDDAGVKRPLILITEFDNDPSTFDPSGDPEIIGKQYANAALTGGHYDASVVADFWPGVDGGTSMAFTEEQQAAYDLVAPVIQEKVVAPQHDTNTYLAEAIAAVAADDKAAIAVALTKVAQAMERGALLLDISAATPK